MVEGKSPQLLALTGSWRSRISYFDIQSSGYQKRLKSLWDEAFVEFQHCTSEHVVEQVRNIKKKNLLSYIDRQLIELQHNIPQGSDIPQGSEENTITTRKDNLTSIGTTENQITMQNTESISNSNEGHENMNMISGVRNEENETEQNQMKKGLIKLWRKNFQKNIEVDINQREHSMKVSLTTSAWPA